MNKSLITLAEESAKIEIALIESGGEITPEIEAWLADVEIDLPEKVENYALIMERMEALGSHYDDRAEMLQRMSRAVANVVERCKENLKIAMVKLETDEIQGVDVRFKMTESAGAVVYENEKLIPPEYTTIEQVVKIDKKRIGEDLKLGVPVDGCRLEKKKVLKKYANSPGKKKA